MIEPIVLECLFLRAGILRLKFKVPGRTTGHVHVTSAKKGEGGSLKL